MQIENYRIRWQYQIAKKTQKTLCFIETPVTNEPIITVAKCMKTDDFDKDAGRKLSLKRALQEANVPKEERVKIWDVYRHLTSVPRW